MAFKDHDRAVEKAPKVGIVYQGRGITRWFKGDLAGALEDFTHPDNAIYFFGNDRTCMSDEDFGGRVPDHYIYIPQSGDDMHSCVAGAIVLYDRYLKRGDFG